MDSDRLRTVLSPTLASLFVILLLCVFIVRRPIPAEGLRIPLYPLHPESKVSGVCNARAIVLWLTKDGRMWINNFEARPDELRPKLAEIFENRAVKKAYVVAHSDVSYGQFADFMSRIVGASPNLQVILLSGKLRKEVESSPTFEGLCEIESPESGSLWVHPSYLH